MLKELITILFSRLQGIHFPHNSSKKQRASTPSAPCTWLQFYLMHHPSSAFIDFGPSCAKEQDTTIRSGTPNYEYPYIRLRDEENGIPPIHFFLLRFSLFCSSSRAVHILERRISHDLLASHSSEAAFERIILHLFVTEHVLDWVSVFFCGVWSRDLPRFIGMPEVEVEVVNCDYILLREY